MEVNMVPLFGIDMTSQLNVLLYGLNLALITSTLALFAPTALKVAQQWMAHRPRLTVPREAFGHSR
jgi:hypothetical protein